MTNNIGSPTYSYSFDGSATGSGSGAAISSLSAGTYGITLTDNQGCSGTLASQTLNDPAAITISAVTANPTTFGGSDGNIMLTITNGTPTYSYSYTGTASGSGTGTTISPLVTI